MRMCSVMNGVKNICCCAHSNVLCKTLPAKLTFTPSVLHLSAFVYVEIFDTHTHTHTLTTAPEDYSVPPTITLLSLFDLPTSTNLIIDLPQESVNTDADFELFRINLVDTFGTAPTNMFFRGTVVTIVDFGKFFTIFF